MTMRAHGSAEKKMEKGLDNTTHTLIINYRCTQPHRHTRKTRAHRRKSWARYISLTSLATTSACLQTKNQKKKTYAAMPRMQLNAIPDKLLKYSKNACTYRHTSLSRFSFSGPPASNYFYCDCFACSMSQPQPNGNSTCFCWFFFLSFVLLFVFSAVTFRSLFVFTCVLVL